MDSIRRIWLGDVYANGCNGCECDERIRATGHCMFGVRNSWYLGIFGCFGCVSITHSVKCAQSCRYCVHVARVSCYMGVFAFWWHVCSSNHDHKLH